MGLRSSSPAHHTPISYTMADITEEQRIEIKAAFDLFDTDGNGSISATELASILKKMGTEASESELKDMIHEIDVDGDGEIHFEEFLLLFSRHKKNQLPEDEELRQVFKVELKRVMDMLGEKLNDAQIDEMMKEADTNGD